MFRMYPLHSSCQLIQRTVTSLRVDLVRVHARIETANSEIFGSWPASVETDEPRRNQVFQNDVREREKEKKGRV